MAAPLSAARRGFPAARSSVRPPDAVLVSPRPPFLDSDLLGRLSGLRLAAAAARAPGLAAVAGAPGHDVREHVLRRLVGGRLLLEPPLRQPAAAARPRP